MRLADVSVRQVQRVRDAVLYGFLLALLSACDLEQWQEKHETRCQGWMQRARTASDSLQVEMTCAQIAATRKSEEAARLAAALGVMAVTSK